MYHLNEQILLREWDPLTSGGEEKRRSLDHASFQTANRGRNEHIRKLAGGTAVQTRTTQLAHSNTIGKNFKGRSSPREQGPMPECQERPLPESERVACGTAP